MGEHAALGPTGCTRGIDENRGIVGAHSPAPGGDLLVGNRFAGGDQFFDDAGGAVDGIDLPPVGELARYVGVIEDHPMGGSLGDDADGLGVAADPVDLWPRRGLVDRYRYGPGGPDCEVEQNPFGPRRAQQCDPVAGLDPLGHETLGNGGDSLGDGSRVERRPGGAGFVEHNRVRRILGRDIEDDVGAVRAVGDGEWRGHGVLGWHGMAFRM